MSEEKNDAFEAALAAASVEPVTVEETPTEAVEEIAQVFDESVLETEDDENDPNAEFRRALRTAAGDWYVVHSYAGYEKKVKGNLQNRIQSLNMEDFIYQIEVPEEEVTEIKNGVRKINVDTDNRLAITGAIRKVFAETPEKFDPRDYLKPAREAMKKVVAQRMTEFGQAGHAGDYAPIPLNEMAKFYAETAVAAK